MFKLNKVSTILYPIAIHLTIMLNKIMMGNQIRMRYNIWYT